MKGDKKMENEAVVTEKKGLSIASMVLGIISIVAFCSTWIAIICSILAIIFGVIGKKKGGAGMAKAGLICGIIGLCLQVALVIFLAALLESVGLSFMAL